jgi:hypothetical protein
VPGGSHALMVSQPDIVADVITQAIVATMPDPVPAA